MKRLVLVLAAIAMPVVTASAQQTITFEDGSNAAALSNGYKGFNWSNFAFLDVNGFPASGYDNGVVSGHFVAFNANGNPAQTIQGASPFTLNSGYFTAAWNDNLQLSVTGFVGGIATYFQTYILETSGPELLTFDWTNLSSITFASSGGTAHGYSGSGTQFGLDNLTLNNPVSTPEPAALILLGTGLAAVGAFGRRRRR